MESVFNINPSNLPELRNINPYNYTFLDGEFNSKQFMISTRSPHLTN